MVRRAFAFDIDGVLLRGGKALKGALPALNLLNKRRIPWILLTNGGGMTETDRVTDLTTKLQLPISPRQFMQSHTPFKNFVGSTDRVLVVGGKNDKCRKVAESYGFNDVAIPADIVQSIPNILPYPSMTASITGAKPFASPTKKFDAIFVFHDPRDATADTQIVIDLLLSKNGVLGTRKSVNELTSKPDVPIYFSNGDMQWVTEYSLPRFGQGAFIDTITSLYKQLTGHELEHTTIGKPTRLTYEYADKLLRSFTSEPIDQVVMVGDNQHSDILGANGYGWESVLVRTGVYQNGDHMFTKPTWICDDVLSGVETVLQQHVGEESTF